MSTLSDNGRTLAQRSLEELKSQISMFHPDESKEIYELVDKLNQVIKHYHASAKLAMMIVCLETSIKEGQ